MSRLRWLLLWRRQQDDLAREMETHLAERVDDLIAQGTSEIEAQAQARREFGNLTSLAERGSQVWRPRSLDVMIGSVRDAGRTVRRSLVTIAACLLVLGASTGLFVVAAIIADNLVVRPIRLPGIDRVVSMGGLAEPGMGWTFGDWWGQAPSLKRLTRWNVGLTHLVTSDGRFLVNTAYVQPGFPDLFPVTPMLGRGLEPDDFVDGSMVPVVISESAWTDRFSRNPAIIGSATTLSDVPVVIVGVLPTRSAYPHGAQVWVPRPSGGAFTVVRSRGAGAGARLSDGATVEDARRDIQALGTRLNHEHGSKTGVTYFGTFSLDTISATQARPLRVPMIALLIGASAVLVMGIANTATLLLNLVVDRRQELAVRAGLGATRRRLVGQLAFESALIGFTSGVLGGASSVTLLIAARPLLAPLSPYLVSTAAVWPTVLAAVGLGTALGFVVGLAPLFLSFAWRDWDLLRHRATDRGARRGRRLRTSLVVVQVTAAMLLMTVAGAALRAFLLANQINAGFEAEQVLAVRMVVPIGMPPREMVDAIAQHARTAGVVRGISRTDRLPVVEAGGMQYIGPDNTSPARVLSIEPGFIDAMGIRLVAGREFAPGDSSSTAVVSETLARRFWPGRSALGQTLQVSPQDRREVIGVVGDIQEDVNADAMWGRGMGGALLYRLLPEATGADTAGGPQTSALVMRCDIPCEDAAPQVRTIVETSGATILDITTLQAAFDTKAAPSRLRSGIAVACGVFGLLLALTSVYGVVRHVASARAQEVNIRVALGASPAQARAVVIRYGTFIVGSGVALGGVLAGLMLAAGRALFYGVSAADPAAYVAAALTLAAGGLLACAGPARDLGRLDTRLLLGE